MRRARPGRIRAAPSATALRCHRHLLGPQHWDAPLEAGSGRAERLHEANRRSIDFGQLTAPRGLVQPLQVHLVVVGQYTLAAVVHDREGLVGTEYLARPGLLADLSKEVTEPEDMA